MIKRPELMLVESVPEVPEYDPLKLIDALVHFSMALIMENESLRAQLDKKE